MNILIIHNTQYPPEIGKTDIIFYLKYFSDFSGGSIDLFCYGNRENYSHNSRIIGVKNRFKFGLLKDLYLSFKSAVYILKNSNTYECIYILNPLFFGIIPAFVGKILGKKIIFDLRTGPITHYELVSRIVIFLDSLIISLSDFLIFINKDIYSELGYFGAGKKSIHETLLGFESTDKISNSQLTLEIPKNKKTFLYIGTLSKRRQLDILIRAFNELKDEGMLYILGSGNDESELRKLAGDNIVFLGSCSHSQVGEYIELFDYGISFIPITKQYNLQPPLKTIEYLGHGKPVFGTSTEGNKKFLNEYNSVLIDDYSNQELILSGIKDIITRKFDSTKIKSSAEKFLWKNIIRGIVIFLKSH